MILMIWTVKACTFAYNIADGQALNAGLKLSERESTHIFRSERALTKVPSLLEYFSYVFFFGGVLVGPCFEAKEYFDFIDGKLIKKYDMTSTPNPIIPTLKCVVTGLLCYIGIALAAMYPILGYMHTPAFGALPFFPKFVYFWISITASRYKYYFAWLLGEAGCVATGFGFNGVERDPKTGKPISYAWNRVTNCNIMAVELAPHMTDVTNNWNMGVNNWLKNYVYFRVEAPTFIRKIIPQKSFINLVTKLTSAFWHGFYPSYYIFFVGAWLAGEMDDALRKSFEPAITPEQKKARAKSWWKGPSNLYEIVSFALNMTVLNFWGICFALLRADYTWEFIKNMHFMGFILPIAVTIICRTFFRPKKVRAIKVDGATDVNPSPSPEAKVVSVAAISSASPNPEPPAHDNIPAKPMSTSTTFEFVDSAADTETEMVETVETSTIKSRPKRTRSNKAE